jgi:WD repeat-containing protein 48
VPLMTNSGCELMVLDAHWKFRCHRQVRTLHDSNMYLLIHRLWSLAAHRCLHTFDHHESSVWALHSNHPNLERFYSGSRDGYLCVTDVEQCTDISDGECVVLSREGDRQLENSNSRESRTGDEGIRSIVSMDDGYVWTSTGSADIKRWKDVGRRIERMDYDGASYGHGDRAALATGLLEPGFQPTPITDSMRNKLNTGSSPAEQQGLLFRTDSRDSRTVAFAPSPAKPNGQDSPSRDPASPRDRLSPTAALQPRSNMSTTSIPASVLTDASGEPDDEDNAMNGIPYASLVCLGMPDSPYNYGFDRDGEHHRAASVSSGPQGVLRTDSDQIDPEHESRHVSIQLDREHLAQQMRPRHHSQARMDFEERELCSDAKPLRSSPDEVIAGRPGLVRSLMLNDRQHVISVDTEGEVAVWNIISGVCVGKFLSADVADALDLERDITAAKAVRKHSNEVLEMIKDRVEGETMVITWCQVDTKIGSLVVHLEEGRVFDAEVYLDDLNIEGAENARDDARGESLS